MSDEALQNFQAKCPPVGNNKPCIVTCDGRDIAGFDTYEEAEQREPS